MELAEHIRLSVVTIRGRRYWKIPYHGMQNKNIGI